MHWILNYDAALRGLKTEETTTRDGSPLAFVAQTFNQNIARIHSLLWLPVLMCRSSALYSMVSCVAVKNITGDFRGLDSFDLDNDTRQAIATEAARIMNESPEIQDGERRTAMDDPTIFEFVMTNMYSLEQARPNTIKPGLETALSGVILGAWTAFEALALDLWVTALDAHPGTLSRLAGKAVARKADMDASKETGKIDLNNLHRYKYDLRNKMGTVLKRRYNFNKLDGIKEAYSAAFSVDGDDVISRTDSREFFRLSAVRNLIVHKAGVVDEEFQGSTKNEPRFAGYKLGERLEVDGDLTAFLTRPAISHCSQLITAVDTWLANHPE